MQNSKMQMNLIQIRKEPCKAKNTKYSFQKGINKKTLKSSVRKQYIKNLINKSQDQNKMPLAFETTPDTQHKRRLRKK